MEHAENHEVNLEQRMYELMRIKSKNTVNICRHIKEK